VKIKINVTKQDIELADMFSNDKCMVARAMRKHKIFENTCVGFNWYTYANTNRVFPRTVATKIFNYAWGIQTPKPFSFTLEV
jgi:hypothetical protein